MKSSGVVVALLLASAAVMSSNVIALQSQQSNVDRDLEEAKTLYREARFTDAIVRLQNTIERLKLLKNLQARKTNLGDAYLHLALSYFALAELPLAKAQLTNVLRSDPDRQLDPQIYAPQVIALFEEARKEVAKEPATAAAVPAPASSSQAAVAKKGGSKAPLILLGVGAAAGGVALAAKGGGSSASATTPTIPTPPPTVSGREDIVLLGSNPPPGSTVRVGQRDVVEMTFSVVYSQNVQDVIVRINIREGSGVGGFPCLFNKDSAPFSLTAGQARTIPVSVPFGTWDLVSSGCALPTTVTEIRAWLQHGTCGGAACIASRPIAVSYNVVQ